MEGWLQVDASIALQQLYVVGILQGNSRMTRYLSQLAAVVLKPATASDSTSPSVPTTQACAGASVRLQGRTEAPPPSHALAPMPLQLSVSFGAAAMQVHLYDC